MIGKTTGIFVVLALLVVMSTSVMATQDKSKTWPKVRVIHASPDAPNVDVWVNGQVAFANAPFMGVTDYASLNQGRYDVQVVPTGATEPVVIDANLKFDPVKDYTVIAVGKLADIEPIVIEDRRYGLPSQKAMVRFVHASADAPAVDIVVKNGPVLFSEVNFKEYTRYMRVNPGTYDLEVRLAGTMTTVLEVPGVTVEASTAYTALALGLVADNTLSAKLLVDRDDSHRTWLYRNSMKK